MVAIPARKKVLEFGQGKQLRCKVGNSRLRIVSSWASASSIGLGPNLKVARRRKVTKEWKPLSVNTRTY